MDFSTITKFLAYLWQLANYGAIGILAAMAIAYVVKILFFNKPDEKAEKEKEELVNLRTEINTLRKDFDDYKLKSEKKIRYLKKVLIFTKEDDIPDEKETKVD